jgi:hypothetical protein
VSTYRTGNHWGVTIVREPEPAGICSDRSCPDRGDHPSHDQAQLVAVVVNGDQELAKRICELLNAPTPDVDHLRGVAEALAEVRRRLAGTPLADILNEILRNAAAELGVTE